MFSTLLALIMIFVLAACSGGNDKANSDGKKSDKVKISVLMGKPEIAQQFEEMIKAYNSSQDEVEVTYIPLAGQNAFEKMSALYASGNPPTIIQMGKEFFTLKDKLLDLSDQEWVEHALPGTTDMVVDNGKVKGMPVTVEGFSLLYNQEVLDKAVGGTFDPSTIKTRDQLKEIFDKVAKVDSVDGAVHISPMDWSLGAHISNKAFTNQTDDRDMRHRFLEELKAGNVDLGKNEVFTGWLDTFDLVKEYNVEKDAPLAPVYDDGPLALATGKVGFWFMGNWALPQLKEANTDANFGYVSFPISNNPEDYGNSQISIGVPSYWTIDATKSSDEEKEAAKKFLNWMMMTEEGQDWVVNKFNFIPVYDNFQSEPTDSLSKALMSYMKDEKGLEMMNNYYPPDASKNMGAIMQKFLAGEIDKAGLEEEFENYWKNVK
ncbi:ABC transporter substrate-binding protein [Neobacillus sp. DY30]|uniref:ABC transporter substrate-binding protein n=1 Tax=Neobacillus sp. DY30 TaxID=3047871 RepID=UPI0024BF423B|nr:ABC transporter substrate-binding protein [Neobacillus sp. DY30]WHY03558.1 ABC transporter substrate-binding protein [Neobacillus sp. DY30]